MGFQEANSEVFLCICSVHVYYHVGCTLRINSWDGKKIIFAEGVVLLKCSHKKGHHEVESWDDLERFPQLKRRH